MAIMFKIILQFIISGSIVVLATYLSPKIGQKWAGLIVAAPLLTLLTFIFLSVESSNTHLRDYLVAALIYMVPAAIFIGSLIIFSDRLHFIPNILVSFMFYAVCVFVVHLIK
jgi:uncharacterized membrane protein (GlpM family)